jgi:acylphosphatase
MSSKRVRYVVRYTGHVQGVGFRMTAVARARGLDLHGFVRNEADGGVLMDVEGDIANLKELMRRIDSSMSGKIDAVDIDERDPRGTDSGFGIKY